MELKKLLLFFLVTGLVVTGIFAGKNSFLLKTPHAPHGMLSFSLTCNNKSQAIILDEWRHNSAYTPAYSPDSVYYAKPVQGLQTAIDQRTADFGFIFFYICLLGFLIYWGKDDYQGFPSAVLAAVVLAMAGITDAIGNTLELMALQGSGGLAFWIVAFTGIKWMLVLFTLAFYYVRVLRPKQKAFLSWLHKEGGELAAQLWNFRIVVIGLLILYIVLSFVDQGEDLLVAIGDTLAGALWFVLAIFVLALLNWYLPKIYDDPANLKNQGSGYTGAAWLMQTYLGRLTGSVTLLVPATGVLSVMQTYHVPYWLEVVPPPLIFLLFILFYIGLLRHRILDKLYMNGKRFLEYRYWLTFALIMALVGILAWFIHALIFPLGSLSLIFFLLSFLFLLTVNYRIQFKNSFPFLPLLYTAAGIIFLLFFLFNVRSVSSSLTQSNRFYSLPVFIAGLVFYTLLASGLLLLGRRLKLQLITSLLVLTTVLSYQSITAFHRVSTVPLTDQPTIKEDSLRAYIHHWLESRRTEIQAQADSGHDYPVFFVNAYGGGIRAAAWTAMAVGRLNYLMQQDKSVSGAFPDFEHYVFSYSGASGGTIGESLLAGARLHHRADPLQDKVFSDTTLLLQVFRHDYLTNDLVGILGRDAWMGSFGLNWCADRAKVTEKAYEDYTRPLGISYDTVIRLGWHDPKMEVPLLVCNTFDVNTSTKGILAPVLLRASDFSGSLLIQQLLSSKQDIHLSSAAFLSARFPYVSPTGKFDEKHHFTDGGTIENSGAETSLQLIHVFNSIKDSLTRKDPIYHKIKICILSLPNSLPAIAKVERTTNTYEMTAPAIGLLNTINGNADKAEWINSDSATRYHWHYFQLFPTDVKIARGKIHPVLPLGWQISDYALEMMNASVAREKTAVDTIRQLFRENFKKKP